MKQSLHDRFLVGEKRRKLERDAVLKATQERVEAERLRAEARLSLHEAQRLLENALLVREGWIESVQSAAWHLSSWFKWRHPTGFEITRSDTGGKTVWTCWQTLAANGVFPPDSVSTGLDSVEQALEWWRLHITDLGRYPEAPPKGLFERLRER